MTARDMTEETAAPARPHVLPFVLSALSVLAGLVFSLGNLGVPGQARGWWFMPRDLWATWRDAQMVSWGQGAYVYTAHTHLLALPGLAVLLAPFAFLADHLHLASGWPVQPPHPGAWLMLDPVALALGTVVLWPLDALALRAGVGGKRRTLIGLVGAGVAWGAVAPMGHPEDLLALALSLWAAMAAADGRWERAAWLMGAALSVQLLAALALPVVIGLAAKNRDRPWMRVTAMLQRAAFLPGVIGLACLAAAPSATWGHLVGGHTSNPWPTPLAVLAPSGYAGPLRLVEVGAAVAVGFVAMKRELSVAALLWWSGLAFSTRVLEPLQCPYYLVPAALLFSLAAVAGRRGKGALAAAVAAVLLGPLTGTSQEYHPWSLWLTLLALVGTMAYGSLPTGADSSPLFVEPSEPVPAAVGGE
ncbi:MAG: hypothetical protein M0Z87_11770 [Actinomycetota bacterium]|nr:hypothetical protein [Actinomycetota bacterium]